MAKRMVKAHALFKSHPGHINHMCELVARRQMDKVASLAKGAKFICHICGRGSSKASSLCEAVEI